ncbi:hypothetical protein D3C87_698040 [compost metagenome]
MRPSACISIGQAFRPMVSSKVAEPRMSSRPSAYRPWMRRVSRMPTCGAISTMADGAKPGTSACRNLKYAAIWRRPSSSPSLSSRASTPFIARPSALRICVTLARHSRGSLLGRRIAPSRGKLYLPGCCCSARAMKPLMAENSPTASSAAGASTWPMRNMVVGNSPLPWPSPTSKGTPAKAATSASPLASMKALARIAWRPDFVSTTSAPMRAPSCSTAAAYAWNSICTPAASSSWSAASL